MERPLTTGKQMIKGTSLTGVGDSGNPSCVEVRDGRILRIRPFDYTENHARDIAKNKWTISAPAAGRSSRLSVRPFLPSG